FRNSTTGKHFYSANPEVELLQGYLSEGNSGYIFAPENPPSVVPLYRLYSASADDHLFTPDLAERDFAIARDGYQDEGVAAWIFPRRVTEDMVALVRYFNGRDHFYTADPAAEVLGGYAIEGTTGYVFAPGIEIPETVPLLRYFNGQNHFYT